MPEANTGLTVVPPILADVAQKEEKNILPAVTTLTRSQKLRMASMVKRGIALACDPEKLCEQIAEVLEVRIDVVIACFNRFSAYTKEQLEERSKLLNKEKHFQRGLLVERLEALYGVAMGARDLKVALAAIKELREVMDLNVKRRKKSDAEKTPSPQRLENMSDEELKKLAAGG